MFQAGVIKLCDENAATNKKIEERVDKIEKYLKSGKINVAPSATVRQPPMAPPPMSATRGPVNDSFATNMSNKGASIKSKMNATPSKPIADAKNFWPHVLNELKSNGRIVLCSNLSGTQAKEINDMTVGIYFPKAPSAFGKSVLQKEENKKAISDLVSITLGKTMNIKYIVENNDAPQVQAEQPKYDIQQIAEGNDIPFNIVD